MVTCQGAARHPQQTFRILIAQKEPVLCKHTVRSYCENLYYQIALLWSLLCERSSVIGWSLTVAAVVVLHGNVESSRLEGGYWQGTISSGTKRRNVKGAIYLRVNYKTGWSNILNQRYMFTSHWLSIVTISRSIAGARFIYKKLSAKAATSCQIIAKYLATLWKLLNCSSNPIKLIK